MALVSRSDPEQEPLPNNGVRVIHLRLKARKDWAELESTFDILHLMAEKMGWQVLPDTWLGQEDAVERAQAMLVQAAIDMIGSYKPEAFDQLIAALNALREP